MQRLLYLSNQSVHSQIQHPALDLTTTLVNFRSSVINARTSFLVGSGRVMSCREFLPILTCIGEHILTSSTIPGQVEFYQRLTGHTGSHSKARQFLHGFGTFPGTWSIPYDVQIKGIGFYGRTQNRFPHCRMTNELQKTCGIFGLEKIVVIKLVTIIQEPGNPVRGYIESPCIRSTACENEIAFSQVHFQFFGIKPYRKSSVPSCFYGLKIR